MSEDRTLKLKARHYRALPIDNPGYEEEIIELPVAQTALIGMHCWNIGCPDGPPMDMNFCVDLGWPQSTEEGYRIMKEVMRPSMDAAREIGLQVIHMEADWMDEHYPDIPSRRDKTKVSKPTGRQAEMIARAHGADYMTKSPLAKMRRCEIVAPMGDEPMVFYTDTLDEYLKSKGIETLIYTGFAADMCVLGSEGGGQAMLSRGYRCILMRDGTVGVERPDTFEEKLATRYGIHIFEWKVGFSTTYQDFITAVDGARTEA
jgi:nicotinamidase-related amidase